MMKRGTAINETEEKVIEKTEEVVEEAKPWVIRLARVGYFTKGVVYMLIGMLVLRGMVGFQSTDVNFSDVMKAIFTSPFGSILLIAVILGLAGYIIWRFVQAILDPDQEGKGVKGLVVRVGYFISALSYSLIAFSAFELLLGLNTEDIPVETITSRMMAQPFGRFLVGLAGILIVGVGLFQFFRAYSASFRKRFKSGEMSRTRRKWALHLGRLGFLARGVIYTNVGGFLVLAAWEFDPDKAADLGEALHILGQQPFGALMLGALAVGLIAYGIYAMLLGRHRRIYID